MAKKNAHTKELAPVTGVGVGDLQLAATRETRRIMREARGNRKKAGELVLKKLHKLELITEAELKSLSKVAEIGFGSAKGDREPEQAYVEVRRIYDEMLAEGQASPTALAIASAEAGSYVSVDDDGEPGVTFKKTSNWEGTLSKAGALIGAHYGGAGGAALGAAIGGVIGKAVDECLEEDTD